MIVFLAIMLHKAPAAFGLVTFLMHEGLDRTRLRRHLIAFSLSAPIAAFITYFGISQSTKETLSDYNATGLILN
jgi:zinc transporter 9